VIQLKEFKSKSRGFIGPIGDDLPSIIAILLGLSLFFSALSFTLNVYNNKLTAYNILKGTMEIAHKVNEKGVITESASDLMHSAEKIAESYGLDFCIKTKVGNTNGKSCTTGNDCQTSWLHFKYFTAFETSNGIKPGTLEVCAG